MPIKWTVEQINALAPDDASVSAAKKLTKLSTWQTLGYDGALAWGECQGSGKDPYKTGVDLTESPAFKCSCPSQKFPCKHSLALFLLLASQENAFTQKDLPAWMVEWIEKRVKQAEQKAKREATKTANQGKPVDIEKQAKRASEREAKVKAGVQELEIWLKDIMRQGLASIQSQNYSFWDKIAARMVDAQIPGIGRMLRELAGISTSGDGWQERLLDRISRIHLLIEGYKRLETLPEDFQQDIRSFMGWTQKQEELLTQSGEQDNWLVLGQTIENDPLNYNLTIQRIWLQGQNSKKFALILNFAFSNFNNAKPLDESIETGTIIVGELIFFPSAYPLRALFKTRQTTIKADNFSWLADISEFLIYYTKAISQIPWLERLPIALENVRFSYDDKGWRLVDKDGYTLNLSETYNINFWQPLALSGGYPIKIFGEWYLDKVSLLTVYANNEFYSFNNMYR
ncbi:MAG: SWIM zinc finger family protein [Acidobacteria bacterium]|nr:SWIM zinc finger family protein [Acidobacteriota bacterium]